MIVNLSGETYDYSMFDGKVIEFPWRNHYPPSIDILVDA
jgi:hypothetical protein